MKSMKSMKSVKSTPTRAPAEQAALITRLTQSRARVLARAGAGTLDPATLHTLANTEISLTLDLVPMPLDPRAHVRAAHAWARPSLERVAERDPTHLVEVDAAHRYTPRTILRRVLDHALDHLNQIEQWRAWQAQGVSPTPTDGWASSAQTLPEDLLPIAPADLDAWLWRIDLTVGLLAQRAQGLTEDQLEWIPPAGGWTIGQMLRHVASAECYYAIWLDDAYSDEPVARYREANRRFVSQLRMVLALPPPEREALFSEGEAPTTAERVAEELLAAEQTALSGQPGAG
jgi:hypothetical protein